MNYVKPLLCTFVVCISFVFNAVQAQFQVDRNYADKTISQKENKLIKNGMPYSNGFLFQNLKQEMKISPNAVIEFKKYEKKKNIGLMLGSAAMIGILYKVPNSSNENTRNALMLRSLGVGKNSIPNSFKSNPYFQQPNWETNGPDLNN